MTDEKVERPAPDTADEDRAREPEARTREAAPAEASGDTPASEAARVHPAVRIASYWPRLPDPFARLPSLRWRRRIFWADRILGGLIATAVGLSLLWAGIYAVAPAPGTMLMVQRAFQGQEVRYRWRPLDEISPDLVRAVIGAEDSRFCAHSGFDFEAIQSALAAAENGGRLRGASTISQQTAKNAFLFPQRSWIRKGAETWFTMLAEAIWPKRRIMEMYLNVAEWGDGLFGAEAAARARFGKPASQISGREAALMAAVLPNPNEWRLDPPGPYVSGRAGSLQRRMGDVRAAGLDSCVLR